MLWTEMCLQQSRVVCPWNASADINSFRDFYGSRREPFNDLHKALSERVLNLAFRTRSGP